MTLIKQLLGFMMGNILIIVLASSAFAQTGDVTFVHDPCIIKSGDYYYIFSTGNRIELRRSNDLQSWHRLNQVFQSIPAWGVQEVPGVSNIWAPDIFFRDSTYYLYYALSTFGSNRSRIGLATNKTLDPDSPDYQWIDQGKVIGSNSENNYNAIDPNVAEDNEGRLWLSFGSFWSGIKLIELDTTTMKPYTDAPIHSIAQRSGVDAIEAPYIIFKNGYFYLFVSFDFCCQGVNSTYKTMVGRSNEITGPYRDRNNVLMTSGGGSLVIASDERWKGPGHCAVLLDGEESWLVHHAYDAEANGIPTLRIEELIWDEDNWPVVENTTSVGEEKRSSTPAAFALYQNYPNPFNPLTNIGFRIAKSGFVTLKVYDVLGREVSILVEEYKSAGEYKIEFNASSLPSGIYFYRLSISAWTGRNWQERNFSGTKKLVLMK
jgi:arabinan endo-1,5-alpha-L-arabinosidase